MEHLIKRTANICLTWPYGHYNYSSYKIPFDFVSYNDCITKCQINYYQLEYQCLIWKFNGIIINLDKIWLKSDNHIKCSENINIKIEKDFKFNKSYINLRKNLCPNDCIDKTFKSSIQYLFKSTEERKNTIQIEFHSIKPMVEYVRTPVMTIIRYFCSVRGLFGI